MSVIGLRVGPFEVREPIRVPERGDWYLAVRTGGGRQRPNEVLVRLLPGDASPADRAALQAEFDTLRALEGLRVPAPVAFYDGLGALAVAAPRTVPVSALIEERKADRVQLSPATLIDLALDLAETLQSAHHRGKFHGHLSPDTLGLAPDGHLWVFGYGLGPWVAPSAGWAAPERATGEPVGPASDQWALGALLAALVTGVPGTDPAAVEAQWPALGRVIRRLLEPSPANRFPAFPAVRQELFALSRRAGTASDRRDLAARVHRLHPDRSATYEAPVLLVPVVESGPPDDDPVLPPVDEPVLIPAPEPEDLETVEVVVRPDPPSHPELAPAQVVAPGARPRRSLHLPSEPLPVVRVVPSSGDPASAPDPALAGTGTGVPLMRVAALDAVATDRTAPPRESAPPPAPEPAVNRPAPIAMPAVPTPMDRRLAEVEVEIDDEELEPALAPDDETDGFHLPADLAHRTTALPGHSSPGEPALVVRPSALSLDFAGPAASESASQGDSWFGPASLASPASEAPTLPLGDVQEPIEALPLRVPEYRPGLSQRLAPVALATMGMSLGVWTVVQFLT